jgi:hypothetical protein
MSADFNEHSSDAVLSKILTQVEGMREDFKASREETEKRLRALEVNADINKGKNFIISAIVAAGVAMFGTAAGEWFLSRK